MKSTAILPLLVLLALLWPTAASAQEQTGTIFGRITDEAGAALADVEVAVSAEVLQGARTATTSASGDYWLPSLPPGTYEVRAEREGYQAYVEQNLRVTVGGRRTVDITLQLASVSETVTITAERPAIDVSSSTSGQTITKEYLDALPTQRSYQQAAQAAPGVTGGSNPNVKGGSSRENRWMLDGINSTDPVTGTFAFNFNVDAIAEIEVITGNFKAENGGSLGGIINVRTESGSNELEGGIKAYYENGNLSPKRDAVYAPDGRQLEGSEFDRDDQDFSLSAYLGGPILKDRLWFFSSLQWMRNVSVALGARSPRVFEGFNMFSKLTATPHPAHHLQLSANISPARIHNTRQSDLVDPEAQLHQAQNSFVIGGEWEWFISPMVKTKLKYSHMKGAIDVTPQPCTWRDDLRFKQCEGDQDEGFIDFVTPGRLGSGGARSTTNGYYYSLNDRYADTVWLDGTVFVPRALGTHEIKVGGSYTATRSDYVFGYTGNLYYVDILEDGDDPSSTVNYYWREASGQLAQTNRGHSIFAFVQDTWEPVRGLTVDLGLKYNRSTMRNDEGERIVGYDILTPVGGITFDPSRRQLSKLYVGGGVVIDEGRLSISSFLDKNGVGRKLYLGPYFSGSETNYSFDQYSYSRSQSDYEQVEHMTAPRVYTLIAGYEMLVGGRTKIGVEGTAKWFRYLWEDDEVNYIWNSAGTNTIGSINGEQSYYFRLRTPEDGQRNYYALTFLVQRQWFKNLLVDINYTMSMTRGITSTQITAALDNPTQREHEFGWLYSDRPHVIKASAAWRAPFGLQVGGTLEVVSGSRFDRTYYAEKGGYQLYQSERGTFDSIKPYWQLDLKLVYRPKLPHGKLVTSVEVFNLTNNRQATGLSQSTLNERGEYFASSRQPPLSLQFGLGYEF